MSTPVEMNTVFAGNPGVGKSTLLNSLVGSVAFKSGVAYGKGLTYEMDKEQVGNQLYMDTPGLSDVDLRQAAGEAIEQALKQSGKYRIVFVITLEAMRVRPVDAATIQTVLAACPTVGNQYGIIINKIKPSKVAGLKENLGEVTCKIFASGVPSTAFVFVNPSDGALDEEDNVFKDASDDLKLFMSTMPTLDIAPEDVGKVEAENLERRSDELEAMMRRLEDDRAEMRKQMEKDREEFRQQIAAMQAKESDGGNAEMMGQLLAHVVPLVTAALSGPGAGSVQVVTRTRIVA